MVVKSDKLIMKAIAICYKPYLKPEEAMIYCNLARTQLARKLDEYRIYKSSTGYYKKEDLDRMMQGTLPDFSLNESQLEIRFKRK
ncbi:MAG: hypothetical protein QM764_13205 [Chitinophagaceae bacterium]